MSQNLSIQVKIYLSAEYWNWIIAAAGRTLSDTSWEEKKKKNGQILKVSIPFENLDRRVKGQRGE